MERDPILYAWRAAPRRHAAAVALALGLGGPLAALALLCLRDLADTLGRDTAAILPYLRLSIPTLSGEVLLAEGWSLTPVALELAAFLTLAGTALALAALGWVVARLCFSAEARAAWHLRRSATDAILHAPVGARDEARNLAHLVGDLLGRIDGLLAVGILVPALTLGAILMAGLAALLAAPRLLPVAVVGLLASGLAGALILRSGRARAALRRNVSELAERALVDLVRRLPAVRRHGAAAQERARLRAKAVASRGALGRAEARLAYARAPAAALAVLLPALALGAALWRGGGAPGSAPASPVTPGALAAAGGAFGLAALLVAVSLRLWFLRADVAPAFREIARALSDLERRRPRGTAHPVAVPEAGPLALSGVSAYEPTSGERLVGADLVLPMPAHTAVTGGRGSGARVLAGVLAGQLEPTVGSVTFDGLDMRTFDPAERARRIAFASGEAILIEGTLRQNILYGTDPAAAIQEPVFVETLRITGLDSFVYARGLVGRIDPAADPDLAGAVVAARQAVRAALAADNAERLVEPFDPDRYNHQATVGENILFGEAVGTAFASGNLGRHPYLRAVLEAEDLTRPLVEIGLQVARSTVEIFADLPNDHPLFDAFSLFPAAERAYFEDLVARQSEASGWRRGPAGQRDRERLIGLSLRYSETRHRFGLIDPPFEERLVAARRSFAAMLPIHLTGQVEFYDPAHVNSAASLEENLLFGRIAYGEAGAEARVRALVRQVLADEGLERAVYRLGLESSVEPGLPGTGSSLGEGAIGPRERIAIDLARCLIRDPDILVVAILLDERKAEDFRERLARLRAARAGRGLVVCLPEAADLAALPPFHAVARMARNTVSMEDEPNRTDLAAVPVI
ncbi:ABC transporter ATP-binding protein [Methylobacterium durans]|uniref:ABC transporter ATP-binding protein n=1 Tax=Methylobacterium durans TaxID=2202825 RepID=UPI002AFF697D|nr:ABC transporter ATP-binding protein [Methylobacterium durans]MEA1832505.1 ABC transporter ATP-binding protein [Methylobacterium durans]